jgi:hypothetical protein
MVDRERLAVPAIAADVLEPGLLEPTAQLRERKHADRKVESSRRLSGTAGLRDQRRSPRKRRRSKSSATGRRIVLMAALASPADCDADRAAIGEFKPRSWALGQHSSLPRR